MKLCLSFLVAGCLLLGACARPIPPLSLPWHISLEDFLANGDQYCSKTPFIMEKETLQLRKVYASTAEDTAVYNCRRWKDSKYEILHGYWRYITVHHFYFHEGKMLTRELAPESRRWTTRSGSAERAVEVGVDMGEKAVIDLLIEKLLK